MWRLSQANAESGCISSSQPVKQTCKRSSTMASSAMTSSSPRPCASDRMLVASSSSVSAACDMQHKMLSRSGTLQACPFTGQAGALFALMKTTRGRRDCNAAKL